MIKKNPYTLLPALESLSDMFPTEQEESPNMMCSPLNHLSKPNYKMGTLNNSSILFLLCFLVYSSIPVSGTSSTSIHENFIECLNIHSKTTHPIPVYTPNTSNYTSILQFSIHNLRFISPATPKPNLIITPLNEFHVQAAVICSRKHGFQIKIRSGGHDIDGLSYISDVPFVILDLFNLRSISIDVDDKSAWVQSGATLGELFYAVAEKSKTLGFPAGVCHTVGVGGHFSGGGYGFMLRKYGFAADHVIDARIVNADGEILLNKEFMGEDLFWAIRGGGGASFGVILSWKIRLVPVPSTVTVFTSSRTLEQGATELVLKWQSVSSKLPEELFIRVVFNGVSTTRNGERTVRASFVSLFLGDSEKLLNVMKERFPELGLERKDCIELSWIQSVLYLGDFPAEGPIDVLLKRTQSKHFYKTKSDYVLKPIPKIGLEEIWKRLMEKEASVMTFNPYGGRMNEISEYDIPFPHRAGNLYMIQYTVNWKDGLATSEKHINWLRNLYSYMTPYVSKSPRASYFNYRDVDLGQSKNGTASYLQAKAWGSKYFKNNYERLVHVKSMVDPSNFFRNEQSIPSIAS